MPQTRLFFRAARPASTALFSALETTFEDEGLPLACIELDEETGEEEISVYAEADDADDVERRIRSVAADAVVSREVLPDIDWVAKSLEGLKPVRAGGFLVHGSHDRDERRPGELAIEIEAGLAFGTGHHGTTAGCLDMLAAVVKQEKPGNALDLGTGSAVLAIALAKLASIPVLATDIDPVAVAVAEENARLNGVAALVETATAAGFDDPVFARRGPFDLIVANILAGPLMELAPHMSRHLVPGGSIVLSGILERQHDAVVAAYVGESFRHVETLRLDGWVTIHLKR